MYKNYVLKSNSCVQSIYKNKIYSKNTHKTNWQTSNKMEDTKVNKISHYQQVFVKKSSIKNI